MPTKLRYRSKLLIGFFGLTLPLLVLVGIHQVFAVSVYDVVETTGTVGTAGTFEVEYTVDTAQQTWVSGDTLTLSVPSNLTVPSLNANIAGVEYDTDTNNDGVGETALAAGPGNGQYSISGSQITVKWAIGTWGAVVNNASTIRFIISTTPVYEGTSSTFTFGGTTANAGDTNPSGSDTINISAGDAAASMTLSTNSVVAAAGDATLSLNLVVRMTTNDTLVFTMPSHLNVTDLAFASETFAGAGTFSGCSAAGQVVTCLAGGAVGPGTGDLVLSGVTSRYAASSQVISSLAVNDNDNAGADIVRDDSAAVTDTTPGSLSNTNVQPVIFIYGARSPNRISFTSGTLIPQSGRIQVVYPAGFDLSAADGQVAAQSNNLSGVWTASVSGQTLTLTQTGGSVTPVGQHVFVVPAIAAPNSYEGGAYQMSTQVAAGNVIEQDLDVDQNLFLPGTKNQEVSLGAISEFAVTLSEEGYPVLTWVEPSASVTFSIDIFREVYPDVAYYFVRVNSGVQSYTDETVSPGQTITYFVRASHADGNGPFSQEITVLIPSESEEVTETVVEEGSSDTETTVADVTEVETVEDTVEDLVEETPSEETPAQEAAVSADVEAIEEEALFQDIAGHESREAVEFLAQNGVLLGNPDGNFAPDSYINKAETAMLMYRLLGSPAVSIDAIPYGDIDSNSWYFTPIAYLYEMDYLDSDAIVYQPNRSMTRDEFMAYLVQVEDSLDAAALCDLEWCQGSGLITRAQAAQVVYEIFSTALRP